MTCVEYNKFPCYGIYTSNDMYVSTKDRRKYKVKFLNSYGKCIIIKNYYGRDLEDEGKIVNRNIDVFELCTTPVIKYNKELQ